MARNIDSENFSVVSRQESSDLTLCSETVSCTARNGLPGATGLRFSQTHSAVFANGAINGLESVNASYCKRPISKRFIASATCGVLFALFFGCLLVCFFVCFFF